MRSSGAFALSCLASIAAAVSHDANARIQHPRQAPPAVAAAGSSSSSSAASSPVASSPATTQSAVSGVPPATPGTSTPASIPFGATVTSLFPSPPTTYSFTLAATNPTALPLSDIVPNAPSAVTSPLDSTYAPGAQPTYLPNAPPLPNAAILLPANYPALDITPPIDTPEVQQWIQEVANSGVTIPNIAPTNPGGCPNNTAAAANTDNCWWTCGGCVRDTDVQECPVVDNWGLTYDDGPAYYTSQLLDYLDEHSLKSTFFVVGSRVISFPEILQTEYMGQHQIAVHTWSHPPLTTLTNEQVIAELGWTKKVIKDVLGVTPNMMRPPYGDIDDRVRAICTAMGLTPVMWSRISPTATFDTGDFYIHSGLTSVQEVLYNWENIVGNASTRDSGFIVLEHDLFQQTVEVATGYILPDALTRNFTIQPVISCLNKPMSDAYIETNDNTTNPPVGASGAVLSLSSGAPGSVEATGAPSTGKNSASTCPLNAGLGMASLAAVAGLGVVLL